MNAERLLQHYEQIADAPDAIARLRRFILDLAVRGKLVPQDASDEPIDQNSLSRELDRKQPTGRTGADLGPVTLAEVPVEVPQSWKWSRLFQLCVQDAPIVYGILQPGPDIRPHGVPYIRPSEIENGQIVLSDIRHTTSEIASQYSRASVQSGDLILTIVGTIGAVALVPQELHGGNITQSSCRLRVDPRFIEPGFLLQALRSSCVIDQINRMRLGTAVPRLNIAHVRAIAIPLPPLAEQHRIVAKVDELMVLCDELEAARTERETKRDRLAAASLARLNTPDPETFHDDARFALDVLPALTARPDQIKQLRQTILNLAVRGKLVPQDPTDEPAEELYAKIERWRLHEIGRKKIRAPRKPLLPIEKKEFPYERPLGWMFARLGSLIYIQSGDGLTAANMKDGPYPVFGGNGINGRHDHHNVDKSTVVIGRVGYYCGSVHVTPERAWVTDNAFITHFPENLIDLRFLVLLLNGTNLKEDENATAQPVISGSKIYPLVVGLPPLAEQNRIVAKVDELMALCDQLETSLTSADETRKKLLDALLAEALVPADEEALQEAAE